MKTRKIINFITFVIVLYACLQKQEDTINNGNDKDPITDEDGPTSVRKLLSN